MMLSEDDKAWMKRNCGKVERAFLYIMVFLTMICIFQMDDKIDSIVDELNHNQKITEALK